MDIVKFYRIVLIFGAVFLAGCVETTRAIVIHEYAAESPILSESVVGGCRFETTDDHIQVNITYEGEKCGVIYTPGEAEY